MAGKTNVAFETSAHVAPESVAPKRGGGRGWNIVGILIIAAIVVVAWSILSGGDFPAVSGSEWQSVFLTNNQVYFGHLANHSRDYVTLSNIFYLQVAEQLQQGATAPGSGFNLVKLGGELHGPQDTMYIPKDKIMFWENLKPDSQVVKAIAGFLKTSGN